MSYAACLDIIKQAAPDLKESEIDDLLTELQKREKRLKAAGVVDSEEAAIRAAQDIKGRLERAALIEKRNAAINEKVYTETIAYLTNVWADKPGDGIEAIVVGNNMLRAGSRDSVANRQITTHQKFMARFIADLKKSGLEEHLTSGLMDDDIARAIWAKAKGVEFKGPKEAQALGEIMSKHWDYWRTEQNKYGAWIGHLDEYVGRQTHDPTKVRRAGFDEWRAAVEDKLDWARILPDMPDADHTAFLKAVYRGLSTGQHRRSGADTPSGFKGPANLAKKISAERVLHFKSADDWMAYNRAFGLDNLREGFFASMNHAAQSIGLLRTLGTNPESMLARLTKDLNERAATPMSDNDVHRAGNYLKAVDGTMRIPVSDLFAKVGVFTRAWQNVSKLGGMITSQFGDIAFMASELNYQGRGYLSAIGETVTGLFRGRGSAEQQQVARMLGVVADSYAGDIAARYSFDQVGGRAARLQDQFFRLNLGRWWQDTNETTAALLMANNLAEARALPFDQLDDGIKRVFQIHSITPERWDVIRQAQTAAADGRNYLAPEAVRLLPDAAIDSLIPGKAADRARAKVRDELEDALLGYYVDRVSFAAIRPDAKTRAIALRGTQPGTVEGEVMRWVTQFKSFPIAATQKALGREVYGYGAGQTGKSVVGVAKMIATATAFGYVSMMAKDALKGREPRDPSDPKTMLAAMVQGGGMGVYGDFVFGEATSRTGGFLQTLAGPTLGVAGDVSDVWGRIRSGDDAGAKALRTVVSNTPYANLFYVKPLLDYFILHSMTEVVSPGALRRREGLVRKENEQEFWLRPSENYHPTFGR